MNTQGDLSLSQRSVLRIIETIRPELSKKLFDVLSVNIDLIGKCDFQFITAILEESFMILRCLFFLFSSSHVWFPLRSLS